MEAVNPPARPTPTITLLPTAVPTYPRHSPPSGQPGLLPAGSSGPGSGWLWSPPSPGPPAAFGPAPPAAPGLYVAPFPEPAAWPEPQPAPGDQGGSREDEAKSQAKDLLCTEAWATHHLTRPSPEGVGLSPVVDHCPGLGYQQEDHPSRTRGPCCPSASLPGIVTETHTY